jgi:CubicO group peptidase (beta-lactamase class C family)
VHGIANAIAQAHRGGPSLFATRIVRHFLDARPTEGSSWALGWDRPSGERPSAGKRFSQEAVGHLGYTGTSLWIDLGRPLWVVLLTNRVYHGREPNRLKAFRPRLHDAVLRTLVS